MRILMLMPFMGIISFTSAQQLETYLEGEHCGEALLTYTEEANQAFSRKEYERALENYQKVA